LPGGTASGMVAAMSEDAGEGTGTSTYRVHLRGLVFVCSIGVLEHEHVTPQRVRVGVEADVVDPGAFRDDLRKVLNYDVVVKGIRGIVSEGHIALVETLAERIAEVCLQDRRVTRVTVSVEKLDVYPHSEGVGASLTRRR
jgi:dihydroneopterin aldolase